jgi:aspartate aminotransferase-like enzyme
MAVLTYSPDVETMMTKRRTPPRTSFLDLLQLQAYWSPERLNHHTAPTSLVYALREALRLVHEDGLDERWRRHRRAGTMLRQGLESLGLEARGDLPYSILQLPTSIDEPRARQLLLDQFGIYVKRIAPHIWRLGMLGGDARPDAVNRVVTAIEKVLSSA